MLGKVDGTLVQAVKLLEMKLEEITMLAEGVLARESIQDGAILGVEVAPGVVQGVVLIVEVIVGHVTDRHHLQDHDLDPLHLIKVDGEVDVILDLGEEYKRYFTSLHCKCKVNLLQKATHYCVIGRCENCTSLCM